MPFDPLQYVALFFAGAFLCNAIPHIVAGLQGAPFPTPFARSRGVGNSSPVVNFIWGAVNLVLGIFILSRHSLTIGPNYGLLVFVVGALFLGLYLALHFGKVRSQAPK